MMKFLPSCMLNTYEPLAHIMLSVSIISLKRYAMCKYCLKKLRYAESKKF